MLRYSHPLILLGLISVLWLAACRGGTPVPTPTPTKTPRPLATPIPIPTPTYSYENCPLTGQPVADVSISMRRPLIIKVGNDTPSRPQAGIHRADIVIEHLAEGGITRLDAVFLCQDFDGVGPVRSARLIDISLAYLFDGILAHVGSSGGVNWILLNETNFPRLDDWRGDPGFYLDPARQRPYSTFTRTQDLWRIAEERGWQQPMSVPPLLFGPLPSGAQAEEISALTIRYFSNNWNTWRWDAAKGRFIRYQNDALHVEATSGEPFSAANVVVLWAQHQTTDIVEDELGALSVRIILNGEGRAALLRNGRLIRGRWSWAGTGSMLRFTLENGTLLPLEVGNTWIQITPPNLEIQTT